MPYSPQTGSHAFGQQIGEDADILHGFKSWGEVRLLPTDLTRNSFHTSANRSRIPPAAKFCSVLPIFQGKTAKFGGLPGPDRRWSDAAQKELAGRWRAPDIEQRLCWQRPDGLPEGIPGNHGDGVRLSQVAAQLCKNFVEGYADGNRDATSLSSAGGSPGLIGCRLLPGRRDPASIRPGRRSSTRSV